MATLPPDCHIACVDADKTDPWFVSDRERNMWMLAAAVVAALYSTLALATTLASRLSDRALLDNVSAAAFFVLFGVVAVVGLKHRAPTIAGAALVVGVAAVYALLFFRMASPIERSHLFEYSLVAILFHEALLERSQRGRRGTHPGLAAVGLASLVGVVDELLQLVIPSRVFDPVDMAFNVVAAGLGVGVSSAVAYAFGRRATGTSR